MALICDFKFFNTLPIGRWGLCRLTLNLGYFEQLNVVEEMLCDFQESVMKVHATSTLFIRNLSL